MSDTQEIPNLSSDAASTPTPTPVPMPPVTEEEMRENDRLLDEEITFFAETNFRREAYRFGIKAKDRRRHMYVIGKTGMGKSTLLENMIIQDIRNGKGLAVVDPHGDLVEKVLKYIPSNRVNDVVYFNPADANYPIAFNILESVNPEYKNLVSNGLVGVFKKIWADSWGPRLEYILINAILGLLEYPGSTLLGVTRMLVDSKYRKKVVHNITDPVVKSFWIDEYNNYSEKFRNEAIAPIQNKVGQFLSSSLIRNIVGQSKSTIEMREIMDSGKILIMNLSKGRIGEENAALLGAMMITKIQLAAMSRVDIPEHTRRDFYLYVDEFQNFATESFANILSEARKYRLDLIMAHQYIEQLSEEVCAAVFGNVGTLVAFRVGSTDAEVLEKEFQPTFMQEDVVTLAAYDVYLRLMIDGVASEPFSATTLPPIQGQTDNIEKVVRVSRERYARNQAEVEEKILRWAGLGPKKEDDEDDEEKKPQPKKFGPQKASPVSSAPTPKAATTPASRIDLSTVPLPPRAQPASSVSSTPSVTPAVPVRSPSSTPSVASPASTSAPSASPASRPSSDKKDIAKQTQKPTAPSAGIPSLSQVLEDIHQNQPPPKKKRRRKRKNKMLTDAPSTSPTPSAPSQPPLASAAPSHTPKSPLPSLPPLSAVPPPQVVQPPTVPSSTQTTSTPPPSRAPEAPKVSSTPQPLKPGQQVKLSVDPTQNS